MSIPFSPTPNALRVEIEASNYFYIALTGVALMAIAAIFYAQLSWSSRALLVALVCLYAGYCWRAQMRQRGMLQWHSAWFWIDDKNAKHALQLRHATVWPGLIALQFYDIERKHRMAFTLLPDSFVFADEARRLRAHLHHFPVFDSETSRDSAD